MEVSQFDYHLPEAFIAQQPRSRGESRLLVLDRERSQVTLDRFARVGTYMPQGALLVLNDTRVFKARLFAVSEKGREIEVFALERLNETDWRVLLRPRKRLKSESLLIFRDSETTAGFVDYENNIIRFNRSMTFADFDRLGEVPLPQYIKREAADGDEIDYQTVYARHTGSIAAPTAGFHFTPQLLEELKHERGIEVAYVTLHIGYATFKPIKSDRLEDHDMPAEHYTVSEETAQAVNRAKAQGRPVIAVGTSSVRTLESSSDEDGRITAGTRSTQLFIYPGYRFRCVDIMQTNFHLPRSSPLMMVCALAGKELIHKSYNEAMNAGFKFYSYGDAMLIK
jgi:S-adenosylmethionine:tRNA ribosyltransferase-isomerase